MVIFCVKCGQEMDSPREAIGRKVSCPACGEVFVAALPKARIVDDEPAPAQAGFPSVQGGQTAQEMPLADILEEVPGPPQPKPAETPDELEQLTRSLRGGGAASKQSDALSELASGGKGPQADQPLKRGWYVLTPIGEVGPFNARQLVLAARRGKLKPTTRIMHSSNRTYIPAGTVPGMFSSRPGPAATSGAPKAQWPASPDDPAAALEALSRKPKKNS